MPVMLVVAEDTWSARRSMEVKASHPLNMASREDPARTPGLTIARSRVR